MATKDFIVFDSDSHVVEPPALWEIVAAGHGLGCDRYPRPACQASGHRGSFGTSCSTRCAPRRASPGCGANGGGKPRRGNLLAPVYGWIFELLLLGWFASGSHVTLR
jgi:hypothetical protein